MTNTETSAPEGVAITIDGRQVMARPGELLIDAAERHGTYIPRFCYHPRMREVGMCRMCLVECDTGRGPALQPACMVPVSPEMTVVTDSEPVKKAQDGVLEFLLINHPLDCPICDKGGECPLQDQTLAYGPGESRFVEIKRTFEKPIPISDTVYLDRERCILCDRCTRFAKEVAGDPLIHFQDRGNGTQVNTFPDHPFASYYSGNVVQICPVGALTAKPYRFKARPWDLEETTSTITTSPTGDGVSIQASRGEILRYMGVDIDAVNWGWLSDKDRFGFEAAKHEHRVTDPLVRGGGLNTADRSGAELVAGSWATAMRMATEALSVDPTRLGVIGGARLTNESAYAWARLVKGQLGCANVDATLGDTLPASLMAAAPRATIDEVCAPGGTILYVGSDSKELAGTLFLRLRHAVVNDGVRLVELTPHATALSDFATASLRTRPGQVASLMTALLGDADVDGHDSDAVAAARSALTGDVRMVAGRTGAAEPAADVAAAVTIAVAGVDGLTVLPLHRRSNTQGAIDMGLAPDLDPGRRPAGSADLGAGWDARPSVAGLDTRGILEAAADGKIDTLVLLGSDPVADFVDRDLAERALATAATVVAVDAFLTESSSSADLVLPVALMGEIDGSFTNIEGRVSAVRRLVSAPGTARAAWNIAAALGGALGEAWGITEVAQLTDEIAERLPTHAGLDHAAIEATPEGIVVTPADTVGMPSSEALAADTGDLLLSVVPTLYDAGTLLQHCPSSAQLSREPVARVNPATAAARSVAGAGSVTVASSRGEITVALVEDADVAYGVVEVFANLPGAEANRLVDAASPLTSVTLTSAG